jgi:hypothetical protein
MRATKPVLTGEGLMHNAQSNGARLQDFKVGRQKK